MPRGVCVTVFLFVASAVGGQVTEFSHRRLDARTGLQHDDLNMFIREDERGFVWIGSSGGVYRYDGHALRYFPLGAQGRPSGVVGGAVQRAGFGVVISHAGGLAHVGPEGESVESVPFAVREGGGEAAPLGPQPFALDTSRGWAWVGDGREAYALDVRTGRRVGAAVASTAVRYLRLGGDGGAGAYLGFRWLLGEGLERICVREEGVVEVAPSRDAAVAGLSFREGALDADGVAWLCTADGLYGYDVAADSLMGRYGLPGAPNTGLFHAARYGTMMLVATDGRGLWWFDPSRRTFVARVAPAYTGSAGGITDRPIAIATTRGGGVLVTRADRGVDVLRPLAPTYRRLRDGSGRPVAATAIAQGPAGEVYVGTRDGRVLNFSPRGGFVADLTPEDLPARGAGTPADARAVAVAWSRTGELLAMAGGRLLARARSGRWRAIAGDVPRGHRLVSTGDGRVAVCGSTDTAYVYAEGDLRDVSLPPSVTSGQRIRYWGLRSSIAAHDYNGLVVLLQPRARRLVATDTLRVGGEIQACGESVTGDSLYFGTLGGLRVFTRDPSGGWVERDSTGQADAQTLGIPSDFIAERWRRLSDRLAYRADGRWRYLRPEHGLPPLTLGGVAYVASDDAAWFESDEGLIRVEASAMRGSPDGAHVYIRAASLNGEPLARPAALPDEGVEFRGTAEQLRLRFGTLGDLGHAAPAFQYRLSGDEPERWRPLRDGDLYVEPLPPGSHGLTVRAIDASGATLAPLRLTLRSTRPYYETWWFRLGATAAVALLAAGLSYLFYRRRLLRERRRYEGQLAISRERERIARELHDDLGGDLATILFLADGAKFTPEDQEEVTALSQGALARMRGIVNALDGESVAVGDLWRELDKHAEATCRRYGVHFRGAGEPDVALAATEISNDAHRHITLFAKEAIGNAVRHGSPSTVSLSLKRASPVGDPARTSGAEASALTLEIADDGRGFDPAAVAAGKGLANLRERADRLRGELAIETADDRGAIVRLTWPLPSE